MIWFGFVDFLKSILRMKKLLVRIRKKFQFTEV